MSFMESTEKSNRVVVSPPNMMTVGNKPDGASTATASTTTRKKVMCVSKCDRYEIVRIPVVYKEFSNNNDPEVDAELYEYNPVDLGIEARSCEWMSAHLRRAFPGRTPCLAAVSVRPGSLADKAGFKKNDYLCWCPTGSPETALFYGTTARFFGHADLPEADSFWNFMTEAQFRDHLELLEEEGRVAFYVARAHHPSMIRKKRATAPSRVKPRLKQPDNGINHYNCYRPEENLKQPVNVDPTVYEQIPREELRNDIDVILCRGGYDGGLYGQTLTEWWERYEFASHNQKAVVCRKVIDVMVAKGIRFLTRVSNSDDDSKSLVAAKGGTNVFYAIEPNHSHRIFKKTLRALRAEVLRQTANLTAEEKVAREHHLEARRTELQRKAPKKPHVFTVKIDSPTPKRRTVVVPTGTAATRAAKHAIAPAAAKQPLPTNIKTTSSASNKNPKKFLRAPSTDGSLSASSKEQAPFKAASAFKQSPNNPKKLLRAPSTDGSLSASSKEQSPFKAASAFKPSPAASFKSMPATSLKPSPAASFKSKPAAALQPSPAASLKPSPAASFNSSPAAAVIAPPARPLTFSERIITKEQVTNSDVILTRGGFRGGKYGQCLSDWWDRYDRTSHVEKGQVAMEVVDYMMARGIRFLTPFTDGFVIELRSSPRIQNKVMRALREEVVLKTQHLTGEQKAARYNPFALRKDLEYKPSRPKLLNPKADDIEADAEKLKARAIAELEARRKAQPKPDPKPTEHEEPLAPLVAAVETTVAEVWGSSAVAAKAKTKAMHMLFPPAKEKVPTRMTPWTAAVALTQQGAPDRSAKTASAAASTAPGARSAHVQIAPRVAATQKLSAPILDAEKRPQQQQQHTEYMAAVLARQKAANNINSSSSSKKNPPPPPGSPSPSAKAADSLTAAIGAMSVGTTSGESNKRAAETTAEEPSAKKAATEKAPIATTPTVVIGGGGGATSVASSSSGSTGKRRAEAADDKLCAEIAKSLDETSTGK